MDRMFVNFLSLDQMVEKFWKIDSGGMMPETKKSMSIEDKRALKKVESSFTLKKGHYEIGLPWRYDEPYLPNNRRQAENRLMTLKKRLLKDNNYLEMYGAQINEYISKGYARKLTESELKSERNKCWYLPHFAVINPMKEKSRIVFDAAARYGNTSLNDQLSQGPEDMSNLLGVLLRFREHEIAIKGDIEGMFHQVKVPVEDSYALRFLWWANADLNGEPEEYVMTVHIFGATSSPFCANFALRKTALDNNDVDESTKETVLRSFYVDDCLKSVDTENEAVKLISNISKLLIPRGFRIHKWITNSKAVMDTVPETDRAPAIVSLNFEEMPIERALGIGWDVKNDSFTFQITLKNKPQTKRGILSTAASLYDPMGMVSPFVFIAKKIIQECWRRQLSWDETIPVDLKREWEKWTEELHILGQLSIPRCMSVRSADIARYDLHYFGDASEHGYGNVVFLRMEYGNEAEKVSCSFVIGKSRLSPLKRISIARLELQAAVTSVRMKQTLEEELSLPIASSTFWTDSMTVLKYIRNETKRFSVFVGNRISEIREFTSVDQWRYVNSENNVAGKASRGQYASDFIKNERWFKGPSFLYKEEKEWPTEPTESYLEENDAELRSFTTSATEHGLDTLMKNISSFNKMKRIFAWIIRFTQYLTKKQDLKKDELSLEEIENAGLKIISYIQHDCFAPEIKLLRAGEHLHKNSMLFKLRPVLLEGVLRVSGRMDFKPEKLESRHQVILPGNHIVTRRIIEEIDKNLKHTSGSEYVLAKSREKYWILRGRKVVKRVLKGCFLCQKVRARLLTQEMANLPSARLAIFEPSFTRTGIDYFGPLYVRVKRSQVKQWGCVFTCMTSRAVHIELVDSLDSSSFINALRRFIALRGVVKEVYSDNGSNFVAANKELKEAVVEWNQAVETNMQQEGIKWHFNPPLASHMGGVWERMIRSIRRILTSLVNKKTLTDFQLMTVFAEATNIINNRPLTSNSDDPRDLGCLTPNHLLLLKGQLSLPTGLFEENDVFHRLQWRKVQFLADEFWQRFVKEYLPTLQERKKWNSAERDIEINDIVLLADRNIPRGKWNVARVLEIYPGRDGHVRSAKVKTAEGIFVRPVVKMCLLEMANRQEKNIEE